MAVWFARSNGDTLHNEPDSPRFVAGEEPVFPNRAFDYRAECLRDGFIRVGWPAAGDLSRPEWRERAATVYGSYWGSHYQSYLEEFLTIRTGDVALMPARSERCVVHIEAVVLRDATTGRILTVRPGLPAYIYRFDAATGARFENAHRVSVLWDADAEGAYGVHTVQGLGGPWRRSFAKIGAAEEAIVKLARALGLPVAG